MPIRLGGRLLSGGRSGRIGVTAAAIRVVLLVRVIEGQTEEATAAE